MFFDALLAQLDPYGTAIAKRAGSVGEGLDPEKTPLLVMRPNVIRFSISHGEDRMYVTSGTDDPARLSSRRTKLGRC
jgi:hypothetical protein